MSDSAQEQASHGDVDHGGGDVDTALVIANEPAPTDHPTESAFDDPATRQDFEALLTVAATDDFDHEP